MAKKTDEEIAAAVQSGDLESFSILVGRYESKIKRYARKFLAGSEDIDDVAQDIFIKSYTNIKSFDSERKFSSWIYRIAHNELVNLLKKKERKPLLFFDPDTLFPHPVSDDSADSFTEESELRHVFNKCFDKIPAKYRESLMLYYFEHLSYKEISDIIRIPVSTVGIRLKRGKKLLKSICKNLGMDYGRE